MNEPPQNNSQENFYIDLDNPIPLLPDNNMNQNFMKDNDNQNRQESQRSYYSPIPVIHERDLDKNITSQQKATKGFFGRLRAMSSDRFNPVLIQLDELDPSPLGVFGTAMGFLFVGLRNVNATDGPILIFPWLILIPGLLQLIAGWVDISRGNLFGALTFTGYGLFWLGFAASLMIAVYATPEVTTDIPDQQVGVAFAGYAVYTIGLIIIALPINISFVILLLLIIAVCILADCEVWTGMSRLPGGVVSLVIALLSFYIYFSLIIRSIIGRDVLPLGPAIFDTKTMKFRIIAFGHSLSEYHKKHARHKE